MGDLYYAEKFENIAGTISYTFETALYEAQFDQPFRNPLSPGLGADYAHDHLGYGVAARDIGRIRVRTMVVASSQSALESAVNEARSECARIGRGYLYRLNQDGSRHRCEARLSSMPSLTRLGDPFLRAPLIFDFVQLSDWMATSATTGSQKVDADPETFTINNPGNLPCYAMTFRFRSDGTGPTTNPSLENTDNGYSFSTTRDLSSANHEIRVNTETGAVEYSTDDGSNYADDYSLFSIPATQTAIMRLEPGDNDMSAAVTSGTPDYTLEWSFYPRYA